MNLRKLIGCWMENKKEDVLRLTRIKRTLIDVYEGREMMALISEFTVPHIPPGLIVRDPSGKEYVTGQEERNGSEDASKVILYPLGVDIKQAKKSAVELSPAEEGLLDALDSYIVVGSNKDEPIQRELLARNTDHTIVDYENYFRKN